MSATARSNGEAASKAGTAYANGTSHPSSSHPASTNGTHKASMANGSSPARSSEPYLGHDREEVTRIIIQALADMGYHNSADGLSKESGYELESPVVASFRKAVLAGEWDDAERLLFGTGTAEAEGATPGSTGLVLTQTANPDRMRFWIRQQKLLELLEKEETSKAINVLRTELTPLNLDHKRLHFLSTLFMSQYVDEMKARAQWDGANGNSRQLLLSELSSKLLPPLPSFPRRPSSRLICARRVYIVLGHAPRAPAIEFVDSGQVPPDQFLRVSLQLRAAISLLRPQLQSPGFPIAVHYRVG